MEIFQRALCASHAGITGTKKHPFGSVDIAGVFADSHNLYQGVKMSRVHQRIKEPFSAVMIAAFGAQPGEIRNSVLRRRHGECLGLFVSPSLLVDADDPTDRRAALPGPPGR